MISLYTLQYQDVMLYDDFPAFYVIRKKALTAMKPDCLKTFLTDNVQYPYFFRMRDWEMFKCYIFKHPVWSCRTLNILSKDRGISLCCISLFLVLIKPMYYEKMSIMLFFCSLEKKCKSSKLTHCQFENSSFLSLKKR